MKIYDISICLSNDLPTFPGDPPFLLEPVTRIANGDDANVSRISISSHGGTHLDPPRHFDDQGVSVDRISLTQLVGKALLVELNGITAISRDELAQLPIKGEQRLLLKTDNSWLSGVPAFSGDFSCLTADGARYLVDSGIKLVGIDYLSIERLDGGGEVHRILLDNGIVVLEGLDLTGVPVGNYELICLPLKIREGDGAPARAILRSWEYGSGAGFDI